MKNLLTIVLVAAGLTLGTLATTAHADEHQHVRYTTFGQDRFVHVPDHFQAHQLASSLNGLGCAAHVHHNGFGFEVHYACTGTRSRTFDCDFEAHRFANWLRGLGFATQIIHH